MPLGASSARRGAVPLSSPVFAALHHGHGADGDAGQRGDGALRLAAGEGRRLQVEGGQRRRDQAGAAALGVGQRAWGAAQQNNYNQDTAGTQPERPVAVLQLHLPRSEPSMERGYLGVEGIFIRSVRYWTLFDEPDQQQF